MGSRFEGIILSFASRPLTGEDLIRALAPSAPELKDRGVPADQVYYLVAEKTVTLRTRDPKIGVLWWLKPEAEGGEVRELHIKPLPLKDCLEDFSGFKAMQGLGAEASRSQNGGLSDIVHVFKGVFGGFPLEVSVSEIAYSGDPGIVGKVGEVTLKKAR